MQENLEAAEMWIWRRVLRVPWTAKKTNEEVLREMETDRELMTTIRKRQLRFLGHIMRREGLEEVVMMGMVKGRRARGKQREKYMDGLMRAKGKQLKPAQMLQVARDRERWRSMVAEVREDVARR